MITGKVTAFREAAVGLVVKGANQVTEDVEAVIDTGFNGFLTLSSSATNRLRLPLVGNRRATLGDGTVVVLDMYLGAVHWHEQEREVLVVQAEGTALIGMSLLYGSKVVLHVIDDGDVLIESWPPQ